MTDAGSKTNPIPINALRVLSDRFLEYAALRDGESLARAHAAGGGLMRALDEFPDLAAAYRIARGDPEEISRAARAAPPLLGGETWSVEGTREVIGAPQRPLFAVGSPEPLAREGAERILEATWKKNPLPERGLEGFELRRFWLWVLRKRDARKVQLEEPGDFTSESYSRWRKERRTQIGMTEAVLELVHRIVAPAAPYLCGDGCNHLGQGLEPVQLKRVLDSLDAFRAYTAYGSEENFTVEYCRNAVGRLLAGEPLTRA